MSTASVLHDWIARLRACSTAGLAADCLALAAVEMSNARAGFAGVFLFDQGKEHLVLAGCQPRGGQERAGEAGVPAWELDDPLAYCVHSGAPCRVLPNQYPVLPLSLETLCEATGTPAGVIEGTPLVAPGGEVLGGFLVSFRNRTDEVSDHVRILGGYAAAVLEGLILKGRHESILTGLRDDSVRHEHAARDARLRPEAVILGGSDAMEVIRSMVMSIAGCDAPVLITGETGTGKEVVATAIHNASVRRSGPLVRINCAALPENLLESELFGHRKGAFSGADSDHQGLLRSANGGSVLLDEIGEMPPAVQAKLLRVLQEHTVRPVGDVRSHAVNIRVLAATNLEMEEAVETGAFRRDLFHRLALLHVKLPPLRERLGDLPVLARHHLAQLERRYRRAGLSIAPAAWPALRAQPYRGNVREFFSMLERAVIMSDPNSAVLSGRDILGASPVGGTDGVMLQDLVRAYESSIILEMMKYYDNKTRDAAKALGVPIRTLNHKLSRFGVVQTSLLQRSPQEPPWS